VIVTSRFTAERVTAMGAAPARIRVVEPGTEAVLRGPAGTEAAPDGPVELLCLGSVVPRKGQAALVRALERMHAVAPALHWRCRVVGSLERDRDYASCLVEAVDGSPVGDQVVLMGELGDRDLEGVWRRADVFVSASRYEGYGMALTEAMMRGLPVVAVAGGAVRFTVPADVGLLVEGGDVEALSEALHTVVSDASLRATLAARSVAHARSLPGWQVQAAAFDRALGELGHE
jgi:glycosyltransferase involved in cell wall biosynthesis